MLEKEGVIFNKTVEFLISFLPEDSEIYSFGSRVRGHRFKKKDFDIMIITSEARRFHSKTIEQTFYKKEFLLDDEGKELGKDIFLDLHFTTKSNLSEKQSNILYLKGKQIKY